MEVGCLRRKKDKNILYGLCVFGILSLFTLIRNPIKDWVIVFSFKAFLTGFVDSFITNKWKSITYPVRLCPKIFKINILFDLLLFPMACVWFNQCTINSSLKGIFTKVFAFSIPMTIIETIAERKTRLLNYKNWTSWHTLISLTFTFLFTRGFMGLIRKLDVLLTKKSQ